MTPLDPAAIDTIFRQARTANGFLDKPVSMDLLKQVYELAALGPTSMNTQPTRYVFLQSKEARERLLPAMSPGNLDKTRTAPVTVIGRRPSAHAKTAPMRDSGSVTREQRATRGMTLWFTGLSGSGKSTIANLVEKRLHAQGRHTYILDGDNVRHGLNRDLGFTDADRVENIRRVAETSKLFTEAGMITLVSFISPFRAERRMAREMLDDGEFIEVYIDTPIEVCRERDLSGLYEAADRGDIPQFPGVSATYDRPTDMDLKVDTSVQTTNECVDLIIELMTERGFLGA